MLNITNNNFAAVQAYNLTVQALNFGTVLGTVSIKNVVSVRPLSMKTVRCDAVTTAERKSTHLSFYVEVQRDRIRTEKQINKSVFVPFPSPADDFRCGISSAAFIFE